jgi:Flp pilus assembly secretin CpaC
MKHFVRSVLVSLSLFAVPAFASPAQVPAPTSTQETLILKRGSSMSVKVPGMNRIAIGDPEIAEVEVPDKSAIRLTGLKAGETTLVVWSGTDIKTYRLVVEG